MILIADSGSSKTAWRFIAGDGEITAIQTDGINPFHQTPDEIDMIVKDPKLVNIAAKVYDVFFYGAGCNYDDKKKVVSDSLKKIFVFADITVDHDLLAAARGVCGHERGIACILGTGSNSCLYDGENIEQNSPSLGYILGDEGSGTYMGKKLLRDYLYSSLPQTLYNKFVDKYGLHIDTILDSVYRSYLPNKFLASFSEFIYENIRHPYMYGLVYESFYDFLDRHVCQYEGYKDVPTHFVGSIAFYYQDILQKVADDLELQLGNIIETPAEGLITYHER
ncbi:MAG: N-acetylglucosamine kinase [Cytophagales bacterium]|nr:N-acetylglucosamine kinase [Cytophagales bacterium]